MIYLSKILSQHRFFIKLLKIENISNDCATNVRCDLFCLFGSRGRADHAANSARDFICEFCGKSYSMARFLKTHLKHNCYRNPKSKQFGKQVLKPYSCDSCGVSYMSVNNLRFHQRTECGRTNNCERCGKTFLHNGSLRRHKRRDCK